MYKRRAPNAPPPPIAIKVVFLKHGADVKSYKKDRSEPDVPGVAVTGEDEAGLEDDMTGCVEDGSEEVVLEKKAQSCLLTFV